MSARTVIEHALRVYYADDRDPSGLVEKLLANYDAERDAARGKSSPVGAEATPGFFQPGHLYALNIWRFHCATVAPHPETGEPQAIGWIRISDGSWTTYAYRAAEWGEDWTDITPTTRKDGRS